MKILLIGATGYIGSAIAENLTRTGHEVVALVRDAAGKGELPYEKRVADLTDPAALGAAVTADIDAVIHAGVPSGDQAVDAAAIDALTAPLRGTDRAFVYTSGVWVLGATGVEPVDEDAPVNPLPIVGYRPEIEQQVLGTATDGVRAVVIRPGIVFGRGGGIPALLGNLAREHGEPKYTGAEGVRWPMVQVDDLAELFTLAAERAEAGSLWHGVTQAAVPVRELAGAAGRAAGVVTAPALWPLEEAAAAVGALFADALALDQAVSGQAARDRLGWKPRHEDAVSELANGS